jgi:hypothetical protein
MRLLNLNTLKLREFIDAERPPYVILSHTWGAEEISLQELKLPVSNASYLSTKEGYVKILNFCQKGKENGFEWGWIDTCCIDKTSSAELSEAINSMFRVSPIACAYTLFPILLCFFRTKHLGTVMTHLPS